MTFETLFIRGVADRSNSSEARTHLTPSESWTDCGEKPTNLILRLKDGFNYDMTRNELGVVLHPLPQRDGIIVSLNPPKCPPQETKHIPCDIVLVIDVSGSMNAAAPVPSTNKSEEENNGLSVLDLTRHAARTIIETLDERDRLGLVTYSSEAKTIFELSAMTKSNKEYAVSKIDSLRVEGMTNMWHGIRAAIRLFEKAERWKNVAAMMVLTDGMPNHMCPQQGYVPKLRNYRLPCSIHTFGFGYSIRSGLLKSIAEVGGGNYAFIPDAGLIGTVFVHAVANLQSTYATNASLTVTATRPLELAQTTGSTVEHDIPMPNSAQNSFSSTLTVALGNIMYGQPRDIFIQYRLEDFGDRNDPLPLNPTVNATVTYNRPESEATMTEFASANVEDFTAAPAEWCAYHRFRSSICNFISSIFPVRRDGEHVPIKDLSAAQTALKTLTATIRLANLPDELNQSLLEDLSGEEPYGQISLALSQHTFFNRWGKHYLPSIQNAHAKQYCNSFKDPGPLMYGRDSPLFIKCRAELDEAFDNLPAPKPSRIGWLARDLPNPGERNLHGGCPSPGNMPRRNIRMCAYNRRSNPCFAGRCRIRLDDGTLLPLDKLRPGARVWTPRGARSVVAVLETPLQDKTELCRIGALLVTPWHPVKVATAVEQGEKWVFPSDVAQGVDSYEGSVFSVLLEQGADSEAHAVQVEGVAAVTLGHGVTTDAVGDARAHAFFSSWHKVKRSLERLDKKQNGVVVCGGVARSEKTGRVTGFLHAA